MSTGGWIPLRCSLGVIWTCLLAKTLLRPLLNKSRVPSMLVSRYTGLLFLSKTQSPAILATFEIDYWMHWLMHCNAFELLFCFDVSWIKRLLSPQKSRSALSVVTDEKTDTHANTESRPSASKSHALEMTIEETMPVQAMPSWRSVDRLDNSS